MGKRGGRGKQNTRVSKPALAPQASASVIQQMGQAYGSTTYGPNAPLNPYTGLQPVSGPRQYDYPIATNLNTAIRDGYTPFEILRTFAGTYDAIALCKQVWFDTVANLEPSIEPAPGLLQPGEDASKYDDDIQKYVDFFEQPDNELDIHEWMNAALNDVGDIDAVAIYPHLTMAGDLYGLELIDGATIKPILDDRGRTPLPPFYAYEQINYGAPSSLYTNEQILYLKEHTRTNSAFGFSRVENILMRINMALRKQNFDIAKFTDGNIPPGFLSPRADVGWTPEQLNTYQVMLDSLYAGNDALRSRVKVAPPGSTYTPTSPMDLLTDFDKFCLTMTGASFGVMLPEFGFTETVNKSAGETQEAVTYRRTLKPIAMKFARLFNYILKHFFNERRFIFKWKGYEEADDFGTMATAHVSLVTAGIEGPTDAARALKLPADGPDIPAFVMTANGPFVVADLANAALRKAQVQAQMSGLQMAATTPQDDNGSSSSSQAADVRGGESEGEPESSPQQSKQPKQVQRVADAEQHTGIMFAFFLDAEAAKQLALPDGEPASDLHVTLAFMGDKSDYTADQLAQMPTIAAGFAQAAKPLYGKVSGIGRFTPSDSSNELAPIYASVDVQGLQEFRQKLVEHLATFGLAPANDFAYTPHITLTYIDADAPIPHIEDKAPVYLTLNTLSLAIGDERYAYPLSSNNSEEMLRLAQVDLRRYRNFALARVADGRGLRSFVSANLPPTLTGRIERALSSCKTADEVRLVFSGIQDHQLTETDDGRFFGEAVGRGGQSQPSREA